MDDTVDDNFKPLQLASTIDDVFPLGQVLIATDTADEVELAFVQECLARHAAGDWGEVDRLLKWGNARTLRGDHAMPIVSKYPVGGGRLQITTKADGSVTSVILYEAGHAPPPDAGLPARFDAYEIHGVHETWFTGGKAKVPDDDAESWGVFGHIPGQGLVLIGDFETRESAEEVYARITGRRYGSQP